MSTCQIEYVRSGRVDAILCGKRVVGECVDPGPVERREEGVGADAVHHAGRYLGGTPAADHPYGFPVQNGQCVREVGVQLDEMVHLGCDPRHTRCPRDVVGLLSFRAWARARRAFWPSPTGSSNESRLCNDRHVRGWLGAFPLP